MNQDERRYKNREPVVKKKASITHRSKMRLSALFLATASAARRRMMAYSPRKRRTASGCTVSHWGITPALSWVWIVFSTFHQRPFSRVTYHSKGISVMDAFPTGIRFMPIPSAAGSRSWARIPTAEISGPTSCSVVSTSPFQSRALPAGPPGAQSVKCFCSL